MTRIRFALDFAKHTQVAAVMFITVLALAGFANASDMSSPHSHKAKSGKITLMERTEAGGIVLEPGDYELKEVKTPNGPVIKFVHFFENPSPSEGLSTHDEEVIGEAKITERLLPSPPKRTQLQLASDKAKAVSLEIRGDEVAYLFNAAPEVAKADATTGCVVGQQ